MNQCKKCGSEFEGNFCPNCGAKKEDEKLADKEKLIWFCDGNKKRKYIVAIYVINILFIVLSLVFLATPIAKDPLSGENSGNMYEILSKLHTLDLSLGFKMPFYFLVVMLGAIFLDLRRVLFVKRRRERLGISVFVVEEVMTALCVLSTAITAMVLAASIRKDGYEVCALPILFIVFGSLFAIADIILIVLCARKRKSSAVS